MFLFASEPQDIVADDNGSPSASGMDRVAESYYRTHGVDNASVSGPGGSTVYPGHLWLIGVRTQYDDPEGSPGTWAWLVYAFTTSDTPDWPINSYQYTNVVTAEDIANGLASVGHTVALRDYTDFQIDYIATDVTLD